MGLGATEIVLICLLALILFGGGKLADIGKGLGQGIKNFKQGLRESDEPEAENENERGNRALGDGNSQDAKKLSGKAMEPRLSQGVKEGKQSS